MALIPTVTLEHPTTRQRVTCNHFDKARFERKGFTKVIGEHDPYAGKKVTTPDKPAKSSDDDEDEEDEDDEPGYEDMTNKALKKLLDKREVEYESKVKKSELIELLEEGDNEEEEEEDEEDEDED